MYTDIIEYKLADNVTKDHLLSTAKDIFDSWMSKQPGFISWQINTLSDGLFVDIVQWETESAAKDAEKSMQTDLEPEKSGAWFGCYNMESIQSRNTTEVGKFNV